MRCLSFLIGSKDLMPGLVESKTPTSFFVPVRLGIVCGPKNSINEAIILFDGHSPVAVLRLQRSDRRAERRRPYEPAQGQGGQS